MSFSFFPHFNAEAQLFARRGPLPDSDALTSREWTTFSMSLREPAPIPVAFDFTRFLTSSITFMRQLCEISVYFDDKCLVKLTKSTGVPRDLGIPKGLNNRTPSRNMTIENVQSTRMHLFYGFAGMNILTLLFSPLHPGSSNEVGIYIRN